jgi:hypothetical protein
LVFRPLSIYLTWVTFGLAVTACGGGEQLSSTEFANPSAASISPANEESGSRSSIVKGGLDAHSERLDWEARAELSRNEVEQPSDDSGVSQPITNIKVRQTGARAKAIVAPATAIYRFFNSQTGSHLYTRSSTERDTILNTLAQYRYEGPVFGAWQSSSAGLNPVYRFANRANGTHFYTISESEKNNILATAPFMSLEGPAYYASKTAQAGTTPLYRFYHLQKGFHFYTANAAEKDAIIANLPAVYQYEGVGYYVNEFIGKFDPALASFAGKVNSPGHINATGEIARFGSLSGINFDSNGKLYVVDRFFNWYGVDATVPSEIRAISLSGSVSDFAGNNQKSGFRDGVGCDDLFGALTATTADSAGNIYAGDYRTVRKVTPGGKVETIAGSMLEAGYENGTPQSARFSRIRGIARDSSGNTYISDYNNNAIRRISITGVVSTFAGASSTASSSYWGEFSDGTGTSARFYKPGQIAIDANDNIYVADQGNHRIRKITPAGVVTTLAGQSTSGIIDGQGNSARFDNPYALTVNKATGDVYVADWEGYTVRRVTSTGHVTTVVGAAYRPGVFFGSLPAGLQRVSGLAIHGNRLYIASSNSIFWTNLPQ